jgi:hypothetical protein
VQGIAAITANNGWAMAAVGATIVISGLTVLSIVISQLHKLIALLEKKSEETDMDRIQTDQPVDLSGEVDLLDDLGALARIYQSLTVAPGESFPLTELYKILNAEKLPHPHITIRELRAAGYLVPSGKGTFSWKNA